jgi:hypothetical protein
MIIDEKQESSTLPGKTSENDSTQPTNEKKVLVVTPVSKTEYKQSQDLVEYSSSEEDTKEKEQPSISSKAKGAGKSFKDLIISTGGKVTSSEVSQSLASVGNLEYNRILVPDCSDTPFSLPSTYHPILFLHYENKSCGLLLQGYL